MYGAAAIIVVGGSGGGKFSGTCVLSGRGAGLFFSGSVAEVLLTMGVSCVAALLVSEPLVGRQPAALG